MTAAATDPTTAAAPAPGPDSEEPTVEIKTDPTAERVEDDVVEDEPVEDDVVEDEPVEEDDVEDEPGLRDKLTARRAAAATATANWWGFIARPMSVREAWQRSIDIDAARIPGDSQLLAFLWWLDNRVGRRVLLLLVLLMPTFLNGPLLWCAQRPSRRAGLYLVLFLVLVIVPRVVGG